MTINHLLKLVAKRINNTVKLVIVPNKSNDYRPYLIRRYGLMAIVLIIIGLQLGYNNATTGDILGRESSITINSLFEQTNQMRVQASKVPLKLNDKLDQAAYLKAQDMFAKQYWAHDAPDGTPPWKWLGDVGYNYNEAGENLAKNFTSTSAVMTAWMNSPKHRENILEDDYRDVGFAIVDGDLKGQPTSLIVAFYGLAAENSVASIQRLVTNGVQTKQTDIFTQFIIAIQSISPAAIGGLVILAVVIIIAIMAHIYRHRLPNMLRKSWYRHHGLYKSLGLILIGIVIIFLYSGGQI